MGPILAVKVDHLLEQDLIAACQKRLPYEACGILYGSAPSALTPDSAAGNSMFVDGYEFIRNVSSQAATTFSFHPEDWVSAYYRAQKNQRQIVGYFHSHPQGKAIPSIRDEQGFIPWATYWIISLEEGYIDIAAYQRVNSNTWISLPIVREL